MGTAILLAMPLPLLPLQILWINLVTDSLPALALGLEPKEKDVMQRPPRPTGESLFARGLWHRTLFAGVLMAVGCLVMFDWALREHMAAGRASKEAETAARSMVFLTMAFYQLFNALAIRSDRQSLFTMSPASNWYLYGAVGISALMQAAVIYLPPLQDIFKTTAVTGSDLLISLGVASSILWAIEIEKVLLAIFSRRKGDLQEAGVPMGAKSPAGSEKF